MIEEAKYSQLNRIGDALKAVVDQDHKMAYMPNIRVIQKPQKISQQPSYSSNFVTNDRKGVFNSPSGLDIPAGGVGSHNMLLFGQEYEKPKKRRLNYELLNIKI